MGTRASKVGSTPAAGEKVRENHPHLRRNRIALQSVTHPFPALAAVLVLAAGRADQIADTDLTIVVNDGSGSTVTWRLTCHPPGGTHPNPKAACRALETNGAAALPPVPADKACTQIYGGPETASITGTWQGKQTTMSSFARNDGCQISRWTLMEDCSHRVDVSQPTTISTRWNSLISV
jgi:Subtilisin inhibitor-like